MYDMRSLTQDISEWILRNGRQLVYRYADHSVNILMKDNIFPSSREEFLRLLVAEAPKKANVDDATRRFVLKILVEAVNKFDASQIPELAMELAEGASLEPPEPLTGADLQRAKEVSVTSTPHGHDIPLEGSF